MTLLCIVWELFFSHGQRKQIKSPCRMAESPKSETQVTQGPGKTYETLSDKTEHGTVSNHHSTPYIMLLLPMDDSRRRCPETTLSLLHCT